MDFVTMTMPCPTCSAGPTPGVIRNGRGQPVRCPTCGGEARVPIRVRRQAFDYAWPVINMGTTSGAIVPQELQLDEDAFFELEAWASIENGLSGQPGIEVIDQSNGWHFTRTPVTYPCFFGIDAGTGWSPAPLLVPYIFKPTSVVLMRVTSDGSGGAIQPVMKGYKLYPLDTTAAAALASGKAAA